MKKKEIVYPKEVLAVIPEGMYCHGKHVPCEDFATTGRMKTVGDCPFWFRIKKYYTKGMPRHDGYCVLLGKGDVEINKEAENRKCVVTTCKGGKVDHKETRTYKEWGFPINSVSLLWDRCKECGLKDD